MITPLAPSALYVKAWENSRITKPVVILVGGYAGTGKSTLGKQLAKRLSYSQTLETGIVRCIARTQTTEAENPALFKSTYDLHTMYDGSRESIELAYRQQCQPVTTILKSVISFMAVEKQHLIIAGNHVVPWEDYSHPGCEVIEMYLYVDDADKHADMIGGPTHNRSLDERQFVTGRTIDALLRREATAHHKLLFESADSTERAIELLETRLAKVLAESLY